jgi:hypothetical protein
MAAINGYIVNDKMCVARHTVVPAGPASSFFKVLRAVDFREQFPWRELSIAAF